MTAEDDVVIMIVVSSVFEGASRSNKRKYDRILSNTPVTLTLPGVMSQVFRLANSST